MVTSNVDPSSNVTRAKAAFPAVCFFFGVCAFESDNGAVDVGDFASAGIFDSLIYFCRQFFFFFCFLFRKQFFFLLIIFVNSFLSEMEKKKNGELLINLKNICSALFNNEIKKICDSSSLNTKVFNKQSNSPTEK